MQIGDNLHEISNPVYRNNKKIFQNIAAENFTQSAKRYDKLRFVSLWQCPTKITEVIHRSEISEEMP